jgi:hypothetical protein
MCCFLPANPTTLACKSPTTPCADFAPAQPLFLLMVLAPRWEVTQRLMRPLWPLVLVALGHLAIVSSGVSMAGTEASAPLDLFNELFNPATAGSPGIDIYRQLSEYRNFAAEEWTHVLVWDLFVGRWIWLDGLERGVFSRHSVLLTNLIGPPGLLLHLLTCAILGKGMPPSGHVEELVGAGESSEEDEELFKGKAWALRGR